MVHLGLGVFHRSHQAWYTEQVNRAGDDQWHYASFTGRRPDAAVELAKQDCAYTLLIRGADGDRPERVSSIAVAADGADYQLWTRYLADSRTALVTLTITEAGYELPADGGVADVRAFLADEQPPSAVARLAIGLRARLRAGGAPIAIVSCDNLASNGEFTRRAVLEFADRVDPRLAAWIGTEVSFVSTMVDRITPAVEPTDLHTVERLTGWRDRVPVVAEPFTDWVLAGDFPLGRPDWELAGARFVDNVEPYELRKLFLLNGAHSMLAYLGLARGHATVFDAVSDPVCRQAVEQFWTEAAILLPFDDSEIARAKADLLERWGNPRIDHQLAKIALDGEQKLRVRVAPVLRAYAGRQPTGQVLLLAAWLLHLRAGGLSQQSLEAGAVAVVRQVVPEWDDQGALAAVIARTAAGIEERRQDR